MGGGSAGQPGAGDAGAQSQGGAGGGEGGAGTGEAGSGEAGQGQAGQASGGEGPTCGGFIGAVCEEDQWCDYPDDGLCGNADATGTCRARPEVCTRDCPGVCGCDGRFYCNACTANNLGVDVSQETDCPEAGGLGALCTSDAECEVGLSCCYPCGRAGCQNECMDVANGNCPLLP